jgi:hypothetical protein
MIMAMKPRTMEDALAVYRLQELACAQLRPGEHKILPMMEKT